MRKLRLAFAGVVGAYCLAVAGCSSVGRILDTLPRGKFTELSYSRAGNTTTADVHLTGVVADDYTFRAESIDATFTNPILGKTTIKAKGYERLRAEPPPGGRSTVGSESPPKP